MDPTVRDRHFNRYLVVFFALYFVQGIPYGFQFRFLPLYFRTEGMTLTNVGLLKLLMIPWMLKAVWAPFVDGFFIRKTWLNGSLLIMFLLCLMLIFVNPSLLVYLTIILLVFNLTTAVQDVALDSIMIETLQPSQLARGNIAQVVGYKSGGLFSGGVFSMLTDLVSWETLMMMLATIYFVGYFISVIYIPAEGHHMVSTVPYNGPAHVTEDHSHTLSRREQTGPPRHTQQPLMQVPQTSSPRPNHAPQSVMENAMTCYFWRLFQVDGTIWMMIFVFFYKAGEQGALNMYPMFMIDNGISAHVTGFWTGFVGQFLSILGSFLGGVLNTSRLFSNLKWLLLIRGTLILIMWMGVLMWSSYHWEAYACSVCALQLLYLTGGAMTTITCTLVMHLSQKAPRQCKGSHYTVITTASSLGMLLFSSVVGVLTQEFGYTNMFAIFTCVSFLITFQLLLAPTSVRQL